MGKLNVSKVDVNGVEHIHSNTVGTAPRSRIEFAIKEGLLIFDREYGDYGFTKKSTGYENFWGWLQGEKDRLIPREVNI